MSVYELFMKKGVNLYQDVTIPAEVSKDGQVHTTQTKKNLDRYYDLERQVKICGWLSKETTKGQNVIEERILAAKRYVKTLFADRADGHDVEHTLRVYICYENRTSRKVHVIWR